MFLFVSISIFTAILLVFYIRVLKYELLSPPTIMTIYWYVFIIAGLVSYGSYTWNYKSSAWILLCCILFTMGFVSSAKLINLNKQKPRNIDENIKIKYNLIYIERYLIISIALALLGFFLKLLSYGLSVTSLLSLDSLAAINNDIAISRYSGAQIVTLTSQTLLIFVYLSPLLGGLFYNFAISKKHKVISILSIMPALLLLSINNEKAGIISVLILWVSSFLTGYLVRHKTLPSPTKKTYLYTFSVFVVVMCILVLSMVLRIGEVSFNSLNIALDKLYSSYALGQMPAFDSFYNGLSGINGSLTLGKYTFYSVFDFLKISNRVPGVYSDYFNLGATNTNVYTVFRGIIEDFGKIGGLLIFYIIGIVMGISYRNIKLNIKSPIAISILFMTGLLSFLLYGFIISIFSYVSILFAFAIFYFILRKTFGQPKKVVS